MRKEPKKLFNITLDSLISEYTNKISTLEIDCVSGGLLNTNIGETLLCIQGDIKNIRLFYISEEFDKTFDLIIHINNSLNIIDEIVYPDLLLR